MATTVGFLAPSPPVSSCEAAWREEADIEAAWVILSYEGLQPS